MTDKDKPSCPYCGEEFNDEDERSIHIADNHVDTDSEIVKPSRKRHRDNNLLDRYKSDS